MLFTERCATCHALKDSGAAGNDQMLALLLDKEESKKVAKYIVEVAGR